MIEFQGAGVVAPGGARILKPTTLALSESHVTVIGANGSGKSTLVRLINALATPAEGRVLVDGLDAKSDARKVRDRVGFLFTDPASQLIMPTAVEDVELSLRRRVRGRDDRHAAAIAALDGVGLADKADVSVHALSGGQRQLLAIAGVLALEPSVIVADEPTTLLDLRWRAVVDTLLASLPQQVVEVTHDLDAALRAERTLVVDDGEVVFDGKPRAAISHYRKLMTAKGAPA